MGRLGLVWAFAPCEVVEMAGDDEFQKAAASRAEVSRARWT